MKREERGGGEVNWNYHHETKKIIWKSNSAYQNTKQWIPHTTIFALPHFRFTGGGGGRGKAEKNEKIHATDVKRSLIVNYSNIFSNRESTRGYRSFHRNRILKCNWRGNGVKEGGFNLTKKKIGKITSANLVQLPKVTIDQYSISNTFATLKF